jgi:probable phosphoglycerate mutase
MVIKNPNQYEIGKTTVYFVRHGDRIKIPGTQHPHDFSLSKLGKKQAMDVAKKFSKIKDEIDVLYTSPMKRAYETAVEIGKKIGKKPIVLQGFEEVHKELEHPKIFSISYWRSLKEFKNKQRIFDKILEKNKERVVVLVAHGRLNRMLIGRKLGLSHKKSNVFNAHNCHITLVRFKGKKLDYIHCVNSKDLVGPRS